VLLAAALLAVVTLAGCSRRRERLVVLGLDGLDPDVVALLVSEGKLPNFERLSREGAAGRLVSVKPLLSPIVWTTIATGRKAIDHGITHFTVVDPSGEEVPITSRARRVRALWNIFSGEGRTVGLVGWWATWPVEAVNGVVVSDRTAYHFLSRQVPAGKEGAEGSVYPPALQPRIEKLIRRPSEVQATELATFVDVPVEELARPFDFQDDLSHFRWALATAETYKAIGLALLMENRPDLLMVYIEGTDSTSHLFGHLFRTEGLAGELAVQKKRYGRAVEAMYVWADRLVGDYLAAIEAGGGDATLAVLSDHGFALGVLPDDPSQTRDVRRVSEKEHRLEGVLYLHGKAIRKGVRLGAPSIYDVAPTLLALSGLLPSEEMPGRVLEEALVRVPSAKRVATWEKRDAGVSGREQKASAPSSETDRAMVDHLRNLGYLGGGSSKANRNTAALHLREGRYRDAAALFNQLVKDDPKDAASRAGLGTALSLIGRLPEALEQLDAALAIEPLNGSALYQRGVVLEKLGRREEAIAQHRVTLAYDAGHDSAKKALVRLTGAAEVRPLEGDAERRAAPKVEGARQLAQRGDYPGAMALLDEAARLAPRSVAVLQGQSNVAYLMGDRPRAIRALEKALELEPRNALFRKNLERLRRPAR